jgi:hypothetical protein
MFSINATDSDGAVIAASTMMSSPIETWTQLAPLDDDVANTSVDSLMPSIVIDSPLLGFNVWYQRVHGYLSLAVCAFGIISNAMNIAVLTRRSMISPTNYLLTALASADMAVMIFYLPYAAYFYCVAKPDPDYGHSRQWISYLLFNTNFNITAHTTTMWLTVSLGRLSLHRRLSPADRNTMVQSATCPHDSGRRRSGHSHILHSELHDAAGGAARARRILVPGQ